MVKYGKFNYSSVGVNLLLIQLYKSNNSDNQFESFRYELRNKK